MISYEIDLWRVKGILVKIIGMFLSFGINLKWKWWKDYQEFCFKWNVLLLADIFEKFRHYGLSLSHYLSAPALSWHAMLNMKKVELELISGVACFEKDMIGRVSYIAKRYSKANNKYNNLIVQNKNEMILYT